MPKKLKLSANVNFCCQRVKIIARNQFMTPQIKNDIVIAAQKFIIQSGCLPVKMSSKKLTEYQRRKTWNYPAQRKYYQKSIDHLS